MACTGDSDMGCGGGQLFVGSPALSVHNASGTCWGDRLPCEYIAGCGSVVGQVSAKAKVGPGLFHPLEGQVHCPHQT